MHVIILEKGAVHSAHLLTPFHRSDSGWTQSSPMMHCRLKGWKYSRRWLKIHIHTHRVFLYVCTKSTVCVRWVMCWKGSALTSLAPARASGPPGERGKEPRRSSAPLSRGWRRSSSYWPPEGRSSRAAGPHPSNCPLLYMNWTLGGAVAENNNTKHTVNGCSVFLAFVCVWERVWMHVRVLFSYHEGIVFSVQQQNQVLSMSITQELYWCTVCTDDSQ